MSIRKKHDDYNHFSKQRLANNLTKKFNTTTIGSLAIFEEEIGFLWGHGLQYKELDEDQREWRKIWSTVRTRILDLGNSNLRAAQNEVDQYTLSWNRYVTNFYISEGE